MFYIGLVENRSLSLIWIHINAKAVPRNKINILMKALTFRTAEKLNFARYPYRKIWLVPKVDSLCCRVVGFHRIKTSYWRDSTMAHAFCRHNRRGKVTPLFSSNRCSLLTSESAPKRECANVSTCNPQILLLLLQDTLAMFLAPLPQLWAAHSSTCGGTGSAF